MAQVTELRDIAMWDVFISHAWEDKETVARPLAHALSEAGISVWYDEFTLTLGDSLRRSIDRGLADSRYGLVILSPHFFAKGWPQRELDGLTTREIESGKVILPVWHGVTRKEVEHFSPPLADKLSVSTAAGLDIVMREILKVVRPKATPAPPEAAHQPQEDQPQFEPKPDFSVSWPAQFSLRRLVSTIHNHPYVLATVFLIMIIISIGEFIGVWSNVRSIIVSPRPNGSQSIDSTDLKHSINDLNTYYKSGVSNMKKGRCDLAINDFSQVLILDPNHINAYYNRGVCYMQIGGYDKAIRDFSEIIKRDPSRDKAYYNRGVSYTKMGQKNKAIDDFKKVLELSSDTTLRQRAENNLKDMDIN
jgi:hypothetical protein